MKKTLAIVLAVVMAAAALSGLAFIIGSNEVKADFELVNIYAVDIDLTQAGLREYQEIKATTEPWTPGKSLAIAVEFRVWNRTLDGHAGAAVGDTFTIAVTSTTADMSFCEYAVTKVASYVSINGKKSLSYVGGFPIGTVDYDATSKAALFNVAIYPQVDAAGATAFLNGNPASLTNSVINVLNSTIVGAVTAKGYVPTQAFALTAAGVMSVPATYFGNTVAVPVLNYGLDPQCVDYTLFLSAKHIAPNEQNVGDLQASFALSWGDSWVSLYTGTWPALTAVADAAAWTDLNAFFNQTGAADIVQTVTLKTADLLTYYRGTAIIDTPVTATTLAGAPVYTAYLDLSAAGYLVIRADALQDVTISGTVKTVALVRYDVFKYTPELRKADLHYLGSYLTENLLLQPGASAIHFEYNGGVVTLDMTGSYILSSIQVGGTVPAPYVPTASNPLIDGAVGDWDFTVNPKLSFAVATEAKEIAELTKMHADFATGTGQAYGYPILNGQFTALSAAAKFSTPITNTYVAGTHTPIAATVADEETESGEEVVDGEGEPTDEVEVSTAGDATIAFVCAAAAILACAALAFVMKKAR